MPSYSGGFAGFVEDVDNVAVRPEFDARHEVLFRLDTQEVIHVMQLPVLEVMAIANLRDASRSASVSRRTRFSRTMAVGEENGRSAHPGRRNST